MKQYNPKSLVKISRYQNFFPTLDAEIQKDIYARMAGLLEEEKEYCDKGNYEHIAQIVTSIAIYEVLQRHGKSEDEAHKIVSEEMWAFLDPSAMQKLSKKSFFYAAYEKSGAVRIFQKERERLALHMAPGRRRKGRVPL